MKRGYTLVEVIVAIGVMGVMLPIAVISMSKAALGLQKNRMEEQCQVVVAACMAEVQSARNGQASSSGNGLLGDSSSSVWDTGVFGFDEGGELIGRLSQAQDTKGVKELGGRAVVLIARLDKMGQGEMTQIKIGVEYPAKAKAVVRKRRSFYYLMR